MTDNDRRHNRAMRQKIRQLQADGFIITKREPAICVERWPQRYQVSGNVLVKL